MLLGRSKGCFLSRDKMREDMKLRKSTRSFALLLCIALFVCMLGTTTAFAYSLEDAEKVYNRTTTFNHVDIRANGTITYKTYENGVETGSVTKAVKISNPVITIWREGVAIKTKSFTNTTSYEWRWTGITVNKTDTVSLTCDITIDGVTKTGQQFSWAGKDDFVQAIYNCDGHQGLDFIVTDEEVTQTFFYQVDYKWDNAPSSVTLPTDGNHYAPNANVNVNTTYKTGDTVTENGYVYTFSGWTDYTPKGGSAVQLKGAKTFTITADTTVHGAWSKAPVPTPEYNVVYEWDNAPSSATLPTDSNSYKSGDTVNVDTTYDAGKPVIENGYVYTFSGWTEYTPEGGSTIQLNGATSFAITADTTVYGVWSKIPEATPTPKPTWSPKPEATPTPTPEETPTPTPEATPTPTPEATPTPTPEVTPTPVPTYRPDPTPLPTPEPVDPPQTGDSNSVLQWVAVLLVASTVLAGAALIKRKYSK